MFTTGLGLLALGSLVAVTAAAFGLVPLSNFGTGLIIAGAIIMTGSDICDAIKEK